MQVKVFHSAATLLSDGATAGMRIQDIETSINAWLRANPGVEVVDIKLAGLASSVGENRSEFAMYAMLLYRKR